MTFSISFSNTQKLCFDSHFFHFTRYWIIVIFLYFLFRFFKILSTSKDFLLIVSSFTSMGSKLIDRDRLYESESDADFNWVIEITKCIRELLKVSIHMLHYRLFAWSDRDLHVDWITWSFLSLTERIHDLIVDKLYRLY
jgi:hypothetical protein